MKSCELTRTKKCVSPTSFSRNTPSTAISDHITPSVFTVSRLTSYHAMPNPCILRLLSRFCRSLQPATSRHPRVSHHPSPATAPGRTYEASPSYTNVTTANLKTTYDPGNLTTAQGSDTVVQVPNLKATVTSTESAIALPIIFWSSKLTPPTKSKGLKTWAGTVEACKAAAQQQSIRKQMPITWEIR